MPINKAKVSHLERLEEAAGIAPEKEPEPPYKKGEYIRSGEEAREWTGKRPWKKENRV